MDWPGVYGAILSTLVLAWTIRTGLRDRGHLRLGNEDRRVASFQELRPHMQSSNSLAWSSRRQNAEKRDGVGI